SKPGIHRFVLQDTIPHRDVGTYIVGDRFDHAVSGVDHVTWNIAEGICQWVRIKVLLIHPDTVKSQILQSEINRCSEQNQIFEWLIGEKRGIHGSHCSTHAEAEQRELFGMGMSEYFSHRTGNII